MSTAPRRIVISREGAKEGKARREDSGTNFTLPPKSLVMAALEAAIQSY
jgi:hypothetical protein